MPFKQQWLLTASSCLALSLANANETTATENNETTVSTISTIKGDKTKNITPPTVSSQPNWGTIFASYEPNYLLPFYTQLN